MDIIVYPGTLSGTVRAIPSKSQAHRLLILASFAQGRTELVCAQTNRDMDATADCLRALGAQIERTDEGYSVTPALHVPKQATLRVRDSGSTLRFLLPVAGALGVDATFCMEGRLPSRPLSPLWEELTRGGYTLTRPTPDTLRCTGQLEPGVYTLDGGVSSQFVTGLLLAGSLLDGQTSVQIIGRLESKPYVELTLAALAQFGAHCSGLRVQGGGLVSPGTIAVEGDWSSAAFFLGANALGSHVTVEGLRADSAQGDRAAQWLLPELTRACPTISVADIPDLAPILAVCAAAQSGCTLTDCARLRLKESDRVESVRAMLASLGGKTEVHGDTLTIYGTGLRGGTVDTRNDHRIAMAAAIAATVCREPVTILDAQCSEKSYPRFFAEFGKLGGKYEQRLRAEP